ncbi:MAG TPA: alpha/beta hydrolase [Myxococcota bacterium]
MTTTALQTTSTTQTMPTTTVFRSPEAKQKMRTWYAHFLAKLTFPYEQRTVSTRAGDTSVVLLGPVDAPPLVVLHGALSGAPHALADVQGLAKDFRVIGVDVVGQSVASAEVRPNIKDSSYGDWLFDVVDALGYDTVSIFAASWGGVVCLKAMQSHPERIDDVVLLVPGGIVSAPASVAVPRVAIPMLLFRMFPTPKRLRAFVKHQLSTVDDDWERFLGDALQSVNLDFRVPPAVQPEQLARFKGRVFAIGADDDVHFPGQAMLKRAPSLFPRLQTELLHCKHNPPSTAAFWDPLLARITAFLQTTTTTTTMTK